MNWFVIKIYSRRVSDRYLNTYTSRYKLYPNTSLFRILYPEGISIEGKWAVLRFNLHTIVYPISSIDVASKSHIIGECPFIRKTYGRIQFGDEFEL